MSRLSATSSQHSIARPWLIGVYSALGLGLLETAGLAYLKLIRHDYVHYAPHQVWTAPLSNVLIFLPAIAVLTIVAGYRGARAAFRWAVAIFTGAVVFALFTATERIHPLAALLLSAGIAIQGYRLADRIEPFVSRWMRRTIWVLAATVGVLFVWATVTPMLRERRMQAALGDAPAGAPNIFLLILDTVRAQSMSLYGYARPTTPRIAAFARRGVTFEQAWAPAPWTLASHASMFTGRLPRELGVGWQQPYDGRFPLLAEALAEQGYATAAFSANGLYVTHESGLDRGFAHFEAQPLEPLAFIAGSALGRTVLRTSFTRWLFDWHDLAGRKYAPEVNRELLDWLDDAPEGRPFFAFLNFFDAHNPYLPPAPYDSIFGSRGAVRNYGMGQEDSLPSSAGIPERNAYEGALAWLDQQIGVLLDSLESRGLLENSVVIIASDHGEAFAEHGWLGHGNTLYSPVLHVPLVIVAPGRLPQGRVIDDVIGTRELARTVMDLALDGRGRDQFPSRSLIRFWSGEGVLVPDTAVAEVDHSPRINPFVPLGRGDMDAVITDTFHLIRGGRGSLELFDLTRDTLEMNNLAHLPGMRDVIRTLELQMRPAAEPQQRVKND